MIILFGIYIVILKASVTEAVCGHNCLTSTADYTLICRDICVALSTNENVSCSDNCTMALINETVACSDKCTSFTNKTEVCIDNCLLKMMIEKCNETTDECLYGCRKGFTGPYCNVTCLRNCVSCTLDTSTQLPDIRCHRCQKGYFRNEGRCERCGTKCLLNASSTLPICKEADGRCEFGCQDTYYGIRCNRPCSVTCKDRLCGGYDGTCSNGCFSMEFTGPNCAVKCNGGCEGGLCHQNGTCRCKPNFWGDTCASSCSDNCMGTPGNDTKCFQIDGKCKFGCLNNTLWGPQCSKICSKSCNNSICDQYKGECTYGCFMQKRFGPRCTKECNVNCTNGMCFQLDGTCIDGCETGWYGKKCTTKCPENCINRTCFSRNGTCTFGCVAAFTGSKCYVADMNILKTERPFSEVAGFALGFVPTAILMMIIIVVYKRRNIINEGTCFSLKRRTYHLKNDVYENNSEVAHTIDGEPQRNAQMNVYVNLRMN